ncbi:unnamed protein product [Lactuca virosa]|uniref:Secreted protein n=1 Tax=Lactuca virosa TaxID=75947 RepID=A0AAU9PIL3_9ASTR|nr:unnamed protein product [Lactuca virosa]
MGTRVCCSSFASTLLPINALYLPKKNTALCTLLYATSNHRYRSPSTIGRRILSQVTHLQQSLSRAWR